MVFKNNLIHAIQSEPCSGQIDNEVYLFGARMVENTNFHL
jgi:hypothetical protein